MKGRPSKATNRDGDSFVFILALRRFVLVPLLTLAFFFGFFFVIGFWNGLFCFFSLFLSVSLMDVQARCEWEMADGTDDSAGGDRRQ